MAKQLSCRGQMFQRSIYDPAHGIAAGAQTQLSCKMASGRVMLSRHNLLRGLHRSYQNEDSRYAASHACAWAAHLPFAPIPMPLPLLPHQVMSFFEELCEVSPVRLPPKTTVPTPPGARPTPRPHPPSLAWDLRPDQPLLPSEPTLDQYAAALREVAAREAQPSPRALQWVGVMVSGQLPACTEICLSAAFQLGLAVGGCAAWGRATFCHSKYKACHMGWSVHAGREPQDAAVSRPCWV